MSIRWAARISLVLFAVSACTAIADAKTVRSKPKKRAPAFTYATWQSFTTRDGARLRLLEDARVTRSGARRDWSLDLEQPDLLRARLELLDSEGQVLDAVAFGRSVADARKWSLDGHEFLAITVDYTCGIGSYCGPITSLYQVSDRRLARVESYDRTMHKSVPIELLQSLKTGWRREKTADGWDIIAVVCRPSLTIWEILDQTMRDKKPEVEFVTAYVRMQFRDGKWMTDWTQRKTYTDITDERDVVRLPTRAGVDPYRVNVGLSPNGRQRVSALRRARSERSSDGVSL